MFITKNFPLQKRKKNRKKDKMILSKKGELMALDRQIRWTIFHYTKNKTILNNVFTIKISLWNIHV